MDFRWYVVTTTFKLSVTTGKKDDLSGFDITNILQINDELPSELSCSCLEGKCVIDARWQRSEWANSQPLVRNRGLQNQISKMRNPSNLGAVCVSTRHCHFNHQLILARCT